MKDWKEWLISWPVIVIAFFVFWPLGCVLLYARSVAKNSSLKANGILLVIISIFCYFMTFVGISVTMEDLNSDLGINIFMIILFLSASIASTVFAVKLLKKYSCCKKYVEKIGIRKKVSIDELSQQFGNSTEITITNVSNAIKYKMIDAYINEYNEIIIKSNNVNENLNFGSDIKHEIVTVQCKSCGANNKFIVGRENKCEFCDSILIKEYAKK